MCSIHARAFSKSAHFAAAVEFITIGGGAAQSGIEYAIGMVDPADLPWGLEFGPKEVGPDGKSLNTIQPLQPASPAFPMMAPITEDDKGQQKYVLADSRTDVEKAEDAMHKSINDK